MWIVLVPLVHRMNEESQFGETVCDFVGVCVTIDFRDTLDEVTVFDERLKNSEQHIVVTGRFESPTKLRELGIDVSL